MRLYVASSNAGKLRDFRAAASVFHVEIEPLPGLEDMPAPEEDAETFEGNARIKAIAYSLAAPGEFVVADDSGLEVDALGGLPGVRSARFADDSGWPGEGSTDERNNACLLAAMRGHALATARYRCVLAWAKDGEVLEVAEGSVEGAILDQPRGTNGFGYDPLFLIPLMEQTMAEISIGEKQALSHRGRALKALLKKIAQTHR